MQQRHSSYLPTAAPPTPPCFRWERRRCEEERREKKPPPRCATSMKGERFRGPCSGSTLFSAIKPAFWFSWGCFYSFFFFFSSLRCVSASARLTRPQPDSVGEVSLTKQTRLPSSAPPPPTTPMQHLPSLPLTYLAGAALQRCWLKRSGPAALSACWNGPAPVDTAETGRHTHKVNKGRRSGK